MVGIAVYLLIFLFCLVASMLSALGGYLPNWLADYDLPLFCALSGGFGGIVYCMRGLYVNYSARKNWDTAWYPWYFIRPVVSVVTGGISFIFLKAGLLVLEAKPENESTFLGFYALAFIAGLNVDKFISKLEDLAQATWGIEKSRASKNQSEEAKSNESSTKQ
jgi:hypothetical protein